LKKSIVGSYTYEQGEDLNKIKGSMMKKTIIKKLCVLSMLALLIATALVMSSPSTAIHAAAQVAATDSGQTNGWANVRTGPGTSYAIATVDAPGTTVTIYDSVSGESVWGGNSTWYRISDTNSGPQYIYSALVNKSGNSNNGNNGSSNDNSNSTPSGSTGTVNSWANVRSSPSTSSAIVGSKASGSTVTIYDTVNGQIVWGGISTWYRISSSTDNAQYIYGGLVTANTNTGASNNPPPAPSTGGKTIVINLTNQDLYAYNSDGSVFLHTLVVTGRPELPTPTGTYHVFAKLSPTTFYSPWPVGSPYYYAPTYINYALEFIAGGYYIHDATWRGDFGPGNNDWHQDPIGGWMTGSHGCVNVTLQDAQTLYNWAPIGTTVQVTP
jgi:lipoprotein-anchoring transpeptidase ErfK/SrfK